MVAENNKIGCALHITKEVNKDWSDTESVYEMLIVVSKALNTWKNED